jgi:5-oxoprolinase (ATP-hydrolysing)
LTITDANLLLGRLQPDFFPHIFGKTEDQPLDLAGTAAAFSELTATINAYLQKTGQPAVSPQDVALGFVRVANEAMW